MFKLLLPFLLVTTVYAQTGDNGRGVGPFFKVVPEAEAHTFFGQTADLDFDPASIKVLVWNIKKAEMVPWEQEFNQYGYDKDLFLIQEAYENELFLSTLGKFQGVRWDMGISFLYRLYNDTATGNMIGSTVAPTYVRVTHTVDNEPVVSTPKATTFAKYAVEGSGDEVLVVSIHAINLTSLGTFQRHLAQVRSEIDKHTGPILLAGDFNTRTRARTQYLMNFAKELNLKAIEFENEECRMRFKGTPYYLDHGFTRGLVVKSASVDCDSIGSDHRPLLIELAVPAK